MPSRSQTRRNLQNEIATSLQISAAGGGLAEISMDRSQQIPKGRCRILSLWDIVQNSIGTTRKPRGRSHSKKCYHHS
jgi:hypothetical protein